MKNIIPIFLMGIGSYSFSGVLEDHLRAIKSPEGRAVLNGEWLYLIKSETKNPYIRHEIYMEKNPEINSDRVHLTYRIKTNTIYDTLKSERPLGCRRSRCYTEGIKIVEYKMDCLSLEYQDIRKWEFSFDTSPNQIHGGYPSIQSGLYFGEEKTSIKSWSKIEQNSIHKVIAGALCKKVLPLRNSEK